MFDYKLTKHLAELSKLNFTESELKDMTAQMSEIVALMDTISDFDSLSKLNEQGAVAFKDLRKDEVKPSLDREDILSNAKERSETFFKVPKVV